MKWTRECDLSSRYNKAMLADSLNLRFAPVQAAAYYDVRRTDEENSNALAISVEQSCLRH